MSFVHFFARSSHQPKADLCGFLENWLRSGSALPSPDSLQRDYRLGTFACYNLYRMSKNSELKERFEKALETGMFDEEYLRGVLSRSHQDFKNSVSADSTNFTAPAFTG